MVKNIKGLMDGSNGGSGGSAPFLTKTYEMVEDPFSDSIVSWSHSGSSFVVWNPPEFCSELLPKYFKHNNFSSFIRQLNTYGFRKIDPEHWEFANEDFVKGQRHLLKNIHRRKPIHSHSLQNQGGSSLPLSDSERREFEEDRERLKQEKSSLQLELQKHEEENIEYELQVRSLVERLKNVELRQRKMMEDLVQLLQNPTFNLLSESNNKRSRLLMSATLYEADTDNNDRESLRQETPDAASNRSLNLEIVDKLDSHITLWGSFIDSLGQPSGEGVGYLPKYAQRSRNLPPSSPESKEMDSLNELDGSSTAEFKLNSRAKISEIDVNAEPASASDVDAKEERVTREVRAGANDVFWEQFLTETPGGSDSPEVQSDRRDTNSRTNTGNGVSRHMYFWNTKNAGNRTEHVGRLASA